MVETKGIKTLEARLAKTRRRLALLAIGEAFWPLVVFVCLFVAAALAGAFERLSAPIGAVVTLLFLIGSILFLISGLRRYHPPKPGAAESVLDRQSALRPISSLKDRPADPSADPQKLWRYHRARLLDEVSKLKVPSFRKRWQAFDPVYLRYLMPLAILVIIGLGWRQAGDRMHGALFPDYGSLVGADKMVIEAWITPPEHSGRAPVFLKPDLQGLRVPEGSRITLRTDAHSAPVLVLDGDKYVRSKFKPTPDGAYEAEGRIMSDTDISVRWWGERAHWKVLASPDDAPTVLLVSRPVVAGGDKFEFAWSATDDYGVERLELVMQRVDPHEAAPEEEKRVRISMPAISPTETQDTSQLDLTRHAWAGLPVKMKLVATDGAGQEGESETVEFTLPEKLFLDPLARAAQEVRVTVLREPREYADGGKNADALSQDAINTSAANRLDRAPGDMQKAALMLDTLTYRGDRFMPNITAYMALRSARGTLTAANSKREAEAIAPLLWALAMKTEFGSAADALRRLEAARRALEQALREGASEEEIKRRMEAFRDAANNYLAARMAEALANGLDAPEDAQDGQAMAGGGPNMGGQDFEDMLNALQDLTETGATDQARQLLSDITNMLENLEFQKGQAGSGGMPGMPGESAENQENLPQEEQEMTDAMKRLSDILREQRQLNDDTLAQERGETPSMQDQGSEGQQSGQSGQQPGQSQTGQGQQPSNQGGQDSPSGEGAADGQQSDQDGPGSATGGRQNDEQGQGGSGDPSEDNTGVGEGEGEGQRPAESLAERQARLGEMVDEFTRNNNIGEGAGENALEGRVDPKALEDIRRAQERARQALEQGNERRAARNQEMATQGLSALSRELAEDLDELREARTGQEQGGGREDPLGRSANGMGNNGDEVEIPSEIERQRAKDILEELRRRYNDADTDEEREYLERLLDRF